MCISMKVIAIRYCSKGYSLMSCGRIIDVDFAYSTHMVCS